MWLLEGLGKGGVQRHVWLIVGEVAELYQQAVLRVELTVPWYQDRREHWMLEQRRFCLLKTSERQKSSVRLSTVFSGHSKMSHCCITAVFLGNNVALPLLTSK